MAARRFRPGLAATLSTLLVATICSGLGWWQLSRAEAREELAARQAEQARQAPQTPQELQQRQDPRLVPVRARGEFNNERNILLDNRMLEGVAGYHVLTPLETENGYQVLVNRGWIPRGRDRDTLPEIPEIGGVTEVVGHAHRYSPRTLVLAEDDLESPSWPLRVQRVDMQALSGVLGVELASFEIRVDPGYPLETGEQFPRVWQDARMTPDRHRAYALQWFALAAAAVIIFLVAGFRAPEPGDEHPHT